MEIKKHTKLNELVADLRNKIGSIYGYFTILGSLGKINDPEKLENIQKILEEALKGSIESMPKVKNLLNQFENFDLDINNNK